MGRRRCRHTPRRFAIRGNGSETQPPCDLGHDVAAGGVAAGVGAAATQRVRFPVTSSREQPLDGIGHRTRERHAAVGGKRLERLQVGHGNAPLHLHPRLPFHPRDLHAQRLQHARLDWRTTPYTPAANEVMSEDINDTGLPPGHVPTVRIAMREPHSAKRHILVPSGHRRDHFTACSVLLGKTLSETGTTAVDDIECPGCRETPEFAAAQAAAHEPPDTQPDAATLRRPALESAPAPTGRGNTRPRKARPAQAPDPQGALF